jgi:hypothetical protein
MSNIEERLWNYVDGSCSVEEQDAIAHLIATNDIYRKTYEEILAFDQELNESIEIEMPPMAFTYNVMEAIRTEEAAKPLKAAIDNRIIKCIAAFFIVTIAALLIFALASTNWSTAESTTVKIPVKLPTVDVKNYFNGAVLKGCLFFAVVFGLVLFDAFLRKARNQRA